MSLQTPDKIRTLQRKLYRKAKAEPAFRFYVLYDKICRDDNLRHAPVRATGEARLAAPGYKVEVIVIAAKRFGEHCCVTIQADGQLF